MQSTRRKDYIKKAKGIPKLKVDNQLPFEKYKRTLNTTINEIITYASIRSNRHDICTLNQEKLGLNNYDDKRYWLSNTESLPYGHYFIATKV